MIIIGRKKSQIRAKVDACALNAISFKLEDKVLLHNKNFAKRSIEKINFIIDRTI